jgi:hypothetical protein
VFYGANETLSWHAGGVCGIDCVETPEKLGESTLYQQTQTLFNGQSSAVILTKDADGTLHTMAKLGGAFTYSEHEWADYVHSCSGGEGRQTPIFPGQIAGQVSVNLRAPRRQVRRRRGGRGQPVAPAPGAVDIELGHKINTHDHLTSTAVTCETNDQTIKFGEDSSTTTSQSFAAFPPAYPCDRSIQGRVSLGRSFSIRVQCHLHTGDPGSQATTNDSLGIYFQLCPRGGRAVDSCPARTIRHPWPPRSPLK